MFDESSQFRPPGDQFEQCFPGVVARIEFSTNDRNGWLGMLALAIDGVQARVVDWTRPDAS